MQPKRNHRFKSCHAIPNSTKACSSRSTATGCHCTRQRSTHLVAAAHARPQLLLAALILGRVQVAQQLHGRGRQLRALRLRWGGLGRKQQRDEQQSKLEHCSSCVGDDGNWGRSAGNVRGQQAGKSQAAARHVQGARWHACGLWQLMHPHPAMLWLPAACSPLRAAAAAAGSLQGRAPAAAAQPSPSPLAPARRRRCRQPLGPATARGAPSTSRPSSHQSGPRSGGLRWVAAGSGCAARCRLGSAARARRCRRRGAAPARSPAQTPRRTGWRGSGAALQSKAQGRQGK